MVDSLEEYNPSRDCTKQHHSNLGGHGAYITLSALVAASLFQAGYGKSFSDLLKA